MPKFNVPLTVVRRTALGEQQHKTMAVVMPDYIAVPVDADVTAGDELLRHLPNKTTSTFYVTDTDVLENPFNSSLDHTAVKYTKIRPEYDLHPQVRSLDSVESSIFEQSDLPYLADALSNGLTQKEINKFELGLGIDTRASSTSTLPPKDTRASIIVKHIFDGPKRDEGFLGMLRFIYFQMPDGDRELNSPEYARLKEILDARGVIQTATGFEPGTSPGTVPVVASPPSADVAPPVGGNGTQTTNAEETEGESSLMSASQGTTDPQEVVDGPKNGKVFIVRGQDKRPVEVLEKFLHFAGLEVLGWNEAEDLTGESQPDTYDVIVKAMDAAAAIIIILSPDDEARLKQDIAGKEQELEGQPRQNVLIEVGMALSKNRKRTILVESGSRRLISDIAGLNWVTMDGTWENRDKLIKRLKRAGAQVKLGHADLNHHLAGPFKVT